METTIGILIGLLLFGEARHPAAHLPRLGAAVASQSDEDKAWQRYQERFRASQDCSVLVGAIGQDFPDSILLRDVLWYEACRKAAEQHALVSLALKAREGQLVKLKEALGYRSTDNQARARRESELAERASDEFLRRAADIIPAHGEIEVLLNHRPTRWIDLPLTLENAASTTEGQKAGLYLLALTRGDPSSTAVVDDESLSFVIRATTGSRLSAMKLADEWDMLSTACTYCFNQHREWKRVQKPHRVLLINALSGFLTRAGKYDRGREEAEQLLSALQASDT